jgi:hypothetical protein
MRKLMGRGKPLDVQPATRRYYDAPEWRRQTQPEGGRQRLENERDVEFRNHLEYVNQASAAGHARLESQFAMHALGSGNGVQAGGGDR